MKINCVHRRHGFSFLLFPFTYCRPVFHGETWHHGVAENTWISLHFQVTTNDEKSWYPHPEVHALQGALLTISLSAGEEQCTECPAKRLHSVEGIVQSESI